MPQIPGTYLDKRYILAIRLHRDRTGILQREMADRIGIEETRFSHILNHHRPASRCTIARVERLAEALLLGDPALESAVDALMEAHEHEPVDESKLMREFRRLPDERKAAAYSKVMEIIRTERVKKT